jgi:hypothetical protein
MLDFIYSHFSVIINSLGLVLDIVGAFLIWKYGLPSSTIGRRGHRTLLICKIDEAETDKAKEYDRNSHFGISFLVIGFILQLVSNFICT